jgi:hypothetical protein
LIATIAASSLSVVLPKVKLTEETRRENTIVCLANFGAESIGVDSRILRVFAAFRCSTAEHRTLCRAFSKHGFTITRSLLKDDDGALKFPALKVSQKYSGRRRGKRASAFHIEPLIVQASPSDRLSVGS